MTATLRDLVNAALNSEDAHEYYINIDNNLAGYGNEVTLWGDSYIVKGSDCSRCDGSHVDCIYIERVTTDPDEALENLQLIG